MAERDTTSPGTPDDIAPGTPQPDDAYFDVMATQAQVHWWYRARRALVTELLAERVPPGSRVIDVGCGTGDNLGALEEIVGRTVVGVELSPYAVRHAPRTAAGDVRVGISRAEAPAVRRQGPPT